MLQVPYNCFNCFNYFLLNDLIYILIKSFIIKKTCHAAV